MFGMRLLPLAPGFQNLKLKMAPRPGQLLQKDAQVKGESLKCRETSVVAR